MAPSASQMSLQSCSACTQTALERVAVYPGVLGLPELHTFRCKQCGHVETIEVAKPLNPGSK